MTIAPARRPARIGIDIGGTGSRWVACDLEGNEIARGHAAGATAHVFNGAERQRLISALGDIAAQLAAHGIVPLAVRAGLTGYGRSVESATATLFSQAFGVDPTIVDDITAAYLAVFRPGEGHVVSAGTGSFGVHVLADGSQVRVGGRGILVDDAGSGSWIALRAVECLYRAHDKSGNYDAMPVLAHHIFEMVGGEDWGHVRAFIYSGDRGRIGTLAMAVARAADEAEPAALSLLSRAGHELAEIAKTLMTRLGPRPIAFIGGALDLHPSIKEALQEALGDCDLAFPIPDPAKVSALTFE